MTLTKAARACTGALGIAIAFIVQPDSSLASPPALAAPPQSGNETSLVELGLRYEHAEGLTRDYDRARALFCQATERGGSHGPYQLAIMRLNGRGIERSDGKAIYWLELARRRGHEHAPVLLQRLGAAAEPDRTLCSGTAAATSGGRALSPPKEISALVDRLAPELDLDPALVTAVIAVESDYRTDARSPKNAQGLMQLIPATAARFGVTDPFDPVQNLRGGMMYLRFLLRLFDGDVSLAAAAYNAGENAVIQYGGVPPYPETERYVKKLREYYGRARHPFSPARP